MSSFHGLTLTGLGHKLIFQKACPHFRISEVCINFDVGVLLYVQDAGGTNGSCERYADAERS